MVSRFLRFSHSYFGVSDSLVYSKRQGLKRSIDWYKKFLISCLVARNSAVFVFKSIKMHGNPCRSTRSTLQNLICYRMSVSRASGTPCGSVFGRFCVSRSRIGVKCQMWRKDVDWQVYAGVIILFVGVMQVVWFHMRFIALVCQPRLPTVNLVALIGPDPPNLRGGRKWG